MSLKMDDGLAKALHLHLDRFWDNYYRNGGDENIDEAWKKFNKLKKILDEKEN